MVSGLLRPSAFAVNRKVRGDVNHAGESWRLGMAREQLKHGGSAMSTIGVRTHSRLRQPRAEAQAAYSRLIRSDRGGGGGSSPSHLLHTSHARLRAASRLPA